MSEGWSWLPLGAARLVHVLGAALWLGSIYFSATALHQRAPKLFERDEAFEAFITGLSDGNRRRHLTAFMACLLSGAALVASSGPRAASQASGAWGLWWALMALKLGLWGAGAALFGVISWRLWPARVFALAQELDGVRRQGTLARWALLGVLGAGACAGVVATLCRPC